MKTGFIVAFFACLVAGSKAAACPAMFSNVETDGSCYFIENNRVGVQSAVTWNENDAICQNLGGHAVVLNTADELKPIRDYIENVLTLWDPTAPVYIFAGSKYDSEFNFFNIDGTKFSPDLNCGADNPFLVNDYCVLLQDYCFTSVNCDDSKKGSTINTYTVCEMEKVDWDYSCPTDYVKDSRNDKCYLFSDDIHHDRLKYTDASGYCASQGGSLANLVTSSEQLWMMTYMMYKLESSDFNPWWLDLYQSTDGQWQWTNDATHFNSQDHELTWLPSEPIAEPCGLIKSERVPPGPTNKYMKTGLAAMACRATNRFICQYDITPKSTSPKFTTPPPDPCKNPNQCKNNGICKSSGSRFECYCKNNYVGKRCQQKCPN